MRSRLPALFACFTSLAVVTSGHDIITTPITFTREISRVVYARCARCHRPGGAAFSLLTYADARPWAAAIKEEALERRMPPWGAVKGFGEFKDDQGLPQEQIALIADWVEGGAPEGDPRLLPKLTDFPAVHPSHPAPAALTVESTLTLKTGITLAGIRPQKVASDASVMVTATRPDGSVEPLVWLYGYQSRFPNTYWFKAELHLEPATRIQVTPPGAATVALLTRQPGAHPPPVVH